MAGTAPCAPSPSPSCSSSWPGSPWLSRAAPAAPFTMSSCSGPSPPSSSPPPSPPPAACLRRGTLAVAIAVPLIAGSNLLVLNEYYNQAVRNGGSLNWTDAIFPLARALRGIPADLVFVADWGMLDSLRLLERGRLPVRVAPIRSPPASTPSAGSSPAPPTSSSAIPPATNFSPASPPGSKPPPGASATGANFFAPSPMRAVNPSSKSTGSRHDPPAPARRPRPGASPEAAR